MSIKSAIEATIESDEGYSEFERIIRDRIAAIDGPVFTTDVDSWDLWKVWIDAIPISRRQHYRCNCCQDFIRKYGGLVTIDEDGTVESVLWMCSLPEVPDFFRPAVLALDSLVHKAKVNGMFLWSEKESGWGMLECKAGWTHLSGKTTCKCFKSLVMSPSQAMAEKKEDYGILCRSIADYSFDVVRQAQRVLDAGAVYRSEKAVGVAKWFAELHQQIDGVKGSRRSNLIWLAVATAPTGFCHTRSTVISTLLDDIVSGLSIESIQRRWKDKLNPLQYQRPTAPPTDGAIRNAEKIFEQMNAASALNRRFATLDDVLSFVWRPAPVGTFESNPNQKGLFDHLRTKKETVKEIDLPSTTMTMEKFREKVLPSALKIEVDVPTTGNFCGLVTAVHPDAVPIMQWDGIEGERRNPVSTYVYVNGSYCSRWNLRSGWTECSAIFLNPSHWQRPDQFKHHHNSVLFALTDCYDTQTTGTGLALFPETLRSEFHSVRSVIEAHSKKGTIIDAEKGNANGISFGKGSTTPLTVRVQSADGRATYRIDRWE